MKRTNVKYKRIPKKGKVLIRKKILGAVFVIVFVISLTACGSDVNEKPEVNNVVDSENGISNSEGQAEITEENIQEKKYSGLTEEDLKKYQFVMEEEGTWNEWGETENWDYLVYDDQGNIIQGVVYESNFEFGSTNDHWYNWEYDNDGKLIKQEMYYSWNEEPCIVTEYEHDETGNVVIGIEHSYSEWSDEEIEKCVFEYDGSGNLVKKIKKYEHDNTYKTYGIYEYQYDANGNKVKMTYYFYEDLQNCKEYIYDNNGILVEEKLYTYVGDKEYCDEYKYEYDDKGNLIRRRANNRDLSWAYEYDAQDTLVRKIGYYIGSDLAYTWEEYKYNEQGNLAKCVEYHSKVNVKDGNCWREYKYDEQGRRIKEDFYRRDGEWLYDRNEYEYDAIGRLVKVVNE